MQAAVGRCRVHQIDTPEINATLDTLEARASVRWPFDQFRAALNGKPGEDWEVKDGGKFLVRL
ncbi:MAG: hypothetical protein ACXW6K_13710 [Candidatus Binatia bacterium]